MLRKSAAMHPDPAREILIVYDKECPLCDAYCRRVRIHESMGVLRLVNARDASEVMKEITRRGLDIDQGMVLQVDDVLYYGADAISTLSLLGSESSAFNRISRWFFGSSTRAKILYPVFRTCRNLLLKIMRKTKVNNLGLPGNQRF